jgi:AraC-like DNA-binding protein
MRPKRVSQEIPVLTLCQSHMVFFNSANWNWKTDRRDHFNLWIALRGVGHFTINQQTFSYSPGFAVLIRPEDQVQAENHGSDRLVNIGLHFVTAPRDWNYFNDLSMASRQTILRNPGFVRELAEYIEYISRIEAGHCARECNDLASQIVRIFFRDRRIGPEDPVDRMIRLQTERIRSEVARGWQVSALAQEIKLSVSQYVRRFRQILGVPPSDFIIEQRLQNARQLLRDSTLTVDEIAESLGYSDVSYFSRQFKAKIGQAPLYYRKLQVASN